MERRTPNRELKNSEDVQDALIEDYFRYNDLSRMEADDILMNISEIESLHYEYVELDLLNLPRDLSTNLNEDSDNQKENVVPSKRFRMEIDEENGGFFLEENLNKNT
jgi:phage pi2 protein 07